MSWSTIALTILIVGAVLSAIFSSRMPKRFLMRACTGREWRRRFPTSSKRSIRRFLKVFIDAFGLPVNHELKFSPDDKVMDIYRDMYPGRFHVDELEVETFVEAVRREFRVDLDKEPNQDITLGQIFMRIG